MSKARINVDDDWDPSAIEDRVILFCAALGLDHHVFGNLPRRVQGLELLGLIEHSGDYRYRLTEAGTKAFVALLESAGIEARIPQRNRLRA
jgi:hypothetical protein